MGAYLLHVSQHILPAVEHPLPLFAVELVDEVCGVVVIGVLIPKNREKETHQSVFF